MSKKVKEILTEISTSNFPKLADFVSDDVKAGSYDSLQKHQIEARANKLRDILIEDALDKAKDCKLAWEDYLSTDECRVGVTGKLIASLINLETSKNILGVVDEICDKLLTNEKQK